MNELLSTNVILAAIISGIIFGLNLRTNFENKVRVNQKPIIRFLRKKSLFGMALNQVFWLIIISIAMTAIAVYILKVGDAYPLSQTDRISFVILWFLAICSAKFFRYLYWKNKTEKL